MGVNIFYFVVGTEMLSGILGSPEIGLSLRQSHSQERRRHAWYGNMTNNCCCLWKQRARGKLGLGKVIVSAEGKILNETVMSQNGQ